MQDVGAAGKRGGPRPAGGASGGGGAGQAEDQVRPPMHLDPDLGQIVEKPQGWSGKSSPWVEIPRHSDFLGGELFPEITQGFFTICQTLVS